MTVELLRELIGTAREASEWELVSLLGTILRTKLGGD